MRFASVMGAILSADLGDKRAQVLGHFNEFGGIDDADIARLGNGDRFVRNNASGARAHHTDAVGQIPRLTQIMGDQKNSRFATALPG